MDEAPRGHVPSLSASPCRRRNSADAYHNFDTGSRLARIADRWHVFVSLFSAPSAGGLGAAYAGRERSLSPARALTDKLTNAKDAHGKEPKHLRETSPRSGKKEKGRGKEGAAPQKKRTNRRPGCAGHALGRRQLENGTAPDHGRQDFTSCGRGSCYLLLSNGYCVPSNSF